MKLLSSHIVIKKQSKNKKKNRIQSNKTTIICYESKSR